MLISVCLFKTSFDDQGLTYELWSVEGFEPWMPVFVPFWEEILLWIGLEFIEEGAYSGEVKEVHSLAYDKPLLWSWQIELVKKLSRYNFILMHNVLSLFVPKNLREKLEKWKFDLKSKCLSYSYNNSKTLTESQSEALAKILESDKVLLHGVTGSWKTEIYVNLIKKNLEEGKQTLLMVPEIILTNQVLDYIKNVFGGDVIVLSSAVTMAKKTDAFCKIKLWEAKIIVGTRSSLFYPYANLWSIIIDEEHDESYISRETPRYDSVEVANFIAEKTGAKLVLWSGTPKVEHFYEALKWKYTVVQLLEEIWK